MEVVDGFTLQKLWPQKRTVGSLKTPLQMEQIRLLSTGLRKRET